MKSGTPNILTAIQHSLFPGAFLAVCALVAALAALKGGRALSYIAIGLIVIIIGIWVYIPLGVAMHYHPDGNYTGQIIAFNAPIVIGAALFTYIVHRHFKNEKVER